MKISHGIEYFFVRLIAGIFYILPEKAALFLGARLGSATNNIWLSRHNVIIDNLKIAYGKEMDDARREEIARDVFVNIGMNLAELSRFPKMSTEKVLQMVEGEGLDSFQEVEAFGKGGLLVGGHIGNWELVGAYINAIGVPVDFLVRGQHNKLVDNYLTSLRAHAGVKVIHSEESGGMLEIIRTLKKNRQVCIVSDQHAGSQGILINFFGQKVSVPRAPATLSVRTGAPIISGYIIRREDNSHYCHFEKPLYPDLSAPQDEEIYRLTKVYTKRIEKTIRKNPSFWLWTHRRFKYQPKTEQSEGSFVE